MSNAEAEDARPSVAIVTVNTDGASFMDEFAESLAAVSYPNYQLVVVDNASKDDSVTILQRHHPNAVVLRNADNMGFTGGCNRGLQYCLDDGYDYVLFLNGDVVVSPDFLEILVAAADERTLVAPKTYLYYRRGKLDDAVGEFDWTRGIWRHSVLGKQPTAEFDRPRVIDNANLSCLLVSVQALREIGLLDDSFFIYYDDTDFVRRAQDAGYRIWIEPAAMIRHRKGATIGGQYNAFGLYYLTRNRPYLIKKHVRSPLRRLAFWVYFTLTRMARMGILIARRRPDLAKAILAGYFDYWRGRMGKTVGRSYGARRPVSHGAGRSSADGRLKEEPLKEKRL